jgi:hypothetical protein
VSDSRETKQVVALAASYLQARALDQSQEGSEELVLGLGETRRFGGPSKALYLRILEVATLELREFRPGTIHEAVG